ncbi:hypothetical protein [Haliscomenobacter sp.]|uniref:hypothetical protein n=1 Tax=Haliscomenobacter sp. TaxID=2717303 RepID=UPI003BA8D9E7
MISINGNVDMLSYPKIDFVWINDLLKDLTDSKLYITLVGRKEDTKTRVRKYKDAIYLWLVLPYQDILAADDTKPIIINTLLEELHRLERYHEIVDVEGLSEGIKERFGKSLNLFTFY